MKLFLLSNNDAEFFVREIVRITGEQINSVRRELENLENIGMLKSKTRERKKYYRVDIKFGIINELKSIFQKSENMGERILKQIKKMGNVDLLILTGVFANNNANVDMIIVGKMDRKKLSEYFSIKLTKEVKQAIRYAIFERDDFLYRVERHDEFIKEAIFSEGNMVVVNNIESIIRERLNA